MTEQAAGKAAGGIARKNALTANRRKEIAEKAAKSRWDKANSILMATHSGTVTIGELTLPCYVLEDGTRVLSERGVLASFGMKAGARDTEENLPRYLRGKNIIQYINPELKEKLANPLWFQYKNESTRKGFPAALLPEICNVWLKARDANALIRKQIETAQMADILMRGLAHVGIIALVDEATGFQKDRAQDALVSILEAFIAKELQPWIKTFPTDFYQEMFRLRGLEFPNGSVKRPQYFGVLTNNIVYDRLAPGIREELQKGIPRNEEGRPTVKYFQKLTQNTGYPKLREHLGSIVTLMKLSDSWDDFMHKLDRMHPKFGTTIPMDLEYKKEEDTGTGL